MNMILFQVSASHSSYYFDYFNLFFKCFLFNIGFIATVHLFSPSSQWMHKWYLLMQCTFSVHLLNGCIKWYLLMQCTFSVHLLNGCIKWYLLMQCTFSVHLLNRCIKWYLLMQCTFSVHLLNGCIKWYLLMQCTFSVHLLNGCIKWYLLMQCTFSVHLLNGCIKWYLLMQCTFSVHFLNGCIKWYLLMPNLTSSSHPSLVLQFSLAGLLLSSSVFVPSFAAETFKGNHILVNLKHFLNLEPLRGFLKCHSLKFRSP